MTKRRVWLTYFALVIPSLSLMIGFAWWRGSTCVACSGEVRLDRPGTYRFESRRFAGEKYHLSFLVDGVVPPDFDWYDQADSHLWADTPPRIHVEVADASGSVVLRESSSIGRGSGWITSGTAGSGPVDVYKFTKLTGVPFRKHVAVLVVERGSPRASQYRATFRIERICEYEALASLIWCGALALAFVLIGLSLAVLLWLRDRRAAREPRS